MAIWGHPQGYTFSINAAGDVTMSGPDTTVAAPPTVYACSFCLEATTAEKHAKHDWHVCPSKYCQKAAIAQAERIYTGLFDIPQTRESALRWAEAQDA